MIYRLFLLAALSVLSFASLTAQAADPAAADAQAAPDKALAPGETASEPPDSKIVAPGKRVPIDLYTDKEKTPEAVAHREASEKVYFLMEKIVKGLDEKQKKHFFIASNNHNLIGTVRTVQGDVGTAVDKCGEHNPDMKDKMDARFKEWNDAINPVLKDADDMLRNMITAQDYAKPRELRELFKAMDDTREKAQSRIDKIPVTTPEACQYLLDKLDETQESMLTILKATLVSPAQVNANEDGGEAPQDAGPAAAPEETPAPDSAADSTKDEDGTGAPATDQNADGDAADQKP